MSAVITRIREALGLDSTARRLDALVSATVRQRAAEDERLVELACSEAVSLGVGVLVRRDLQGTLISAEPCADLPSWYLKTELVPPVA